MHRLIIILLILSPLTALAQERFFVRVTDPDNAILNNTVGGVQGVTIIRNYDFPSLRLNAVSLQVLDQDLLRTALEGQYQENYLFVFEPFVSPTEGTGDDLAEPFEEDPSPVNDPLDALVPTRPIISPPVGHLYGIPLIDIIGTGIDQSHPDLIGLTFAPPISVMPATGGGNLPGDIDYHNHETRLAGCIAGDSTGLLTALGTRDLAIYRSVLCYPALTSIAPAVPTTYTSDCIAALAEVISDQEARLASPYLRNHASVLCFSHSVEAFNTRVGDLDELFDLAWERGIVTCISAGNHFNTAAASSPAGAGESVVYDSGGIPPQRYWPLFGTGTYELPATVGFIPDGTSSEYHLKTGAHDGSATPVPWSISTTIGSGLNTENPTGYGPSKNDGVDLFAPGQDIPIPSTRFADPDDTPTSVMIEGTEYGILHGYQKGSGTSYSSAYTAALATRILQLRPWATPKQVRTAILGALTTVGPIAVMTIPDFTTLDPMSLDYAQWIARYTAIAPFGYFDGGNDAKLADPDGDGIANFVEYFCGLDPRHPDAHLAPTLEIDCINETLTARLQTACYLPSKTTFKWAIESSSNLLPAWGDLGQGAITISPFDPATNGDGVNITGTLPLDLSKVKEFYRLRIYEDL